MTEMGPGASGWICPLVPKVEGKKNFPRKPARPAKKESVTKVVDLESHTFDAGDLKYAAKYQKLVNAIANHVQKEYKGGSEMAKAIRELKLPQIDIPTYPVPTGGSQMLALGESYIWQQDVAEAKKKIAQLKENKKRAYALIIGQCLPKPEGKIQGSDAYPMADMDQDAVKLLLIICGYCCRFDDHQQSVVVLESAKHHVLASYQTSEMSNLDYFEFFKALVGVIETYGGAFGNKPGLIRTKLIARRVPEKDLNSPDPAVLKAVTATCREQYLLCMALQRSDNSCYYQLKTDLSNDMTKGIDNFPKTMVDTMHLISDYKVPPRLQRAQPSGDAGVVFVQGADQEQRSPQVPPPQPQKSCAGPAHRQDTTSPTVRC